MLLCKEAWHFSTMRFDEEDVQRPAGPPEASRQSFEKKENGDRSGGSGERGRPQPDSKTHGRITKIPGWIVAA
jgi:hypothetical protein